MWYWWFMFFINLFLPFVLIIAGKFMSENNPGEINSFVGYRTRRSKKNKETWKFAQQYCGKLFWKIGWVMLALSILVQLPFYRGSEETISGLACVLLIGQLLMLFLAVFLTERALKKNFTKDGKRIESLPPGL